MSSSIRRTDLLALASLRADGRLSNEIRTIQVRLGYVTSSGSTSGSALLKVGLTTVLCSIHGPADCERQSDQNPTKANLDVIVRYQPYAQSDARRNISTSTSSDRRLQELSNFVKKTMESAVLLTLYPRAKISIRLTILADDGSRLPACINATTLALIDAGIPMKDMVCACSAGLITSYSNKTTSEKELIDLNKSETMNMDDTSSIYLECAILPSTNKIVLVQCESRVTWNVCEKVLDVAILGCNAIAEKMRELVRERGSALLSVKVGRVQIGTVMD